MHDHPRSFVGAPCNRCRSPNSASLKGPSDPRKRRPARSDGQDEKRMSDTKPDTPRRQANRAAGHVPQIELPPIATASASTRVEVFAHRTEMARRRPPDVEVLSERDLAKPTREPSFTQPWGRRKHPQYSPGAEQPINALSQGQEAAYTTRPQEHRARHGTRRWRIEARADQTAQGKKRGEAWKRRSISC